MRDYLQETTIDYQMHPDFKKQNNRIQETIVIMVHNTLAPSMRMLSTTEMKIQCKQKILRRNLQMATYPEQE